MNENLKVLILDIETKPMKASVWGLFDQNIGLNQMSEDWSIIAWAAKWEGNDKVFFMDNRHSDNLMDDKALVVGIAALINAADVVVGHNVKKFDLKKINARAAINGLKPIKMPAVTDTLKEAKKVFSFTSNKLEYLSNVINKKFKKLKHKDFPGFELWDEVMKGNQKAWKEMEIYCKHDVLATEELYTILKGWIKTQNFGAVFEDGKIRCRCGSAELRKEGYAYTAAGKYQIYQCKDCGKWPRGTCNLFDRSDTKKHTREVK